jgi:hypothetical protein
MDAFVKNKSEAELLKLICEITFLLDIELDLEFEAAKEGGIKDILKYFKKKKNRKQLNNLLIYFGAIISGVLINVASDNFNKDKELDELTKEEKRLNIKNLKKHLDEDNLTDADTTKAVNYLIHLLSEEHKIKVFKSRFYNQLLKEEKLYKFSTTEVTENLEPISKEYIIPRTDFKKQILENEDKKPISIENAVIEIVSPVLKQGNIKWKGIYDGQSVTFNLLDAEFKYSVINKQYSFINGTSIKCSLQIIQSVNDEGEIYNKEINVFDVIEVFDGIQTVETKKAKNIKELKNQMKIDFTIEE